jgi:transcriptional regulator with XRE-family HTH domain
VEFFIDAALPAYYYRGKEVNTMYAHLKDLRESLHMTQAEFGASVGVAKSTYNNYETGIRDPKSDFWIAVASKYDVTIDYLMGFSDIPRPLSSTSLSSDESTLVTDYRRLDDTGKEYIRHTMAITLQAHTEKKNAVPDVETA